jgi:hypothetical protein
MNSKRDSAFWSHDEMAKLLENELGIEGWYRKYHEFLDDLEQLEDWQHLIFSRRMTDTELRWCEIEKNQILIPNWTLAKITLTTKNPGRFETVSRQAEVTGARYWLEPR